MRSIIGKKGQVNTLAPALIALTVAGMFLILGIIILESIRDTDVVRISGSGITTNESLTIVDGNGVVMTNCSSRPGSIVTMDVVENGSDGVIYSGNYSVSGCRLVATAGTPYNNTLINASYYFTFGEDAYESTNTSVVGIATFADFWEIIVIGIVTAVTIGLLLVVFGRQGRR